MGDLYRAWLVNMLSEIKQGLEQVLLRKEGAKPLAAM